jgi:hypothetical protein
MEWCVNSRWRYGWDGLIALVSAFGVAVRLTYTLCTSTRTMHMMLV